MLSTFHRYAITSLVSLFSLSVYAEDLTPVDVSTDQSKFLQNLNASVAAPIGSTQNNKANSSNTATPTASPNNQNQPIVITAENNNNAKLTANTAVPKNMTTNPPPQSAANTNSMTPTTAASTKIQQLEATQTQLQAILGTMQVQTKQLQTHLIVVKQQLENAQAMQGPSNETPENKQQLQQLLSEYQRMQATLGGMFQQQTQLQTDMATSNQQLIKLQQTLVKPTPTNQIPPAQSVIQNLVASPAIAPVTSPATAPVSTPVTPNTQPVATKNTMNIAPLTGSNTQKNSIPPITTSINSPTSAVSAVPAATPTPSVNIDDIKKPVAPISASTSAATPNTPTIPERNDFNKNAKTLAQPNLNTEKSTTTSLKTWVQDPAIMLRTGLIFIGLALLFMLMFFWPKSDRKKFSDIKVQLAKPAPKTDLDTFSQTPEDEELSSDYDFMSTEEAIPARLDLARGYIEMGKYDEAKEAIEPIFEKGDAQQKKEAKQLLDKIDKADAGNL